jgi:hypothetical protein
MCEYHIPLIVKLTDQTKAAAHHKTLSEQPNPHIGPLTDQSKSSCSPTNI